ncbi:MAG: hypothetical protein A2041_12970 [Bacteroidetes bacterium GWA2_31_9b]|nr:MAG: hypothetical protein A2041_12970 [Bacteroidetes bacterium GWA2_31_9b]
MILFTYIILFVILIYALVILAFATGWVKIKTFTSKTTYQYPKVSIVIAFRNEEENISQLLHSLFAQTYPKDKTEIILVDDHSSDNTVEIIESNTDFAIQLVKLPENQTGKKAALAYGINLSTAEIIITTDADCTMSENWVLSLVNYYLINKPKLLVAPVLFSPAKSMFQKFQSLEFLSLIGSGAGAIGIGRPIMCNGANLLFEKSLYESALLENNYVSGDDIFLLLSAKKKHRKEILFIKSADALVYTKPTQTINDFFKQRIRWTSKSKAYRDFDIVFTAISVAFTNLMLAFTLIASAFNREFLFYFLVMFLIKSIADIMLLVPVTLFFKQQNLMWWFVALQTIYPFYIVFTTLAGIFGKFTWKSRSFGLNQYF